MGGNWTLAYEVLETLLCWGCFAFTKKLNLQSWIRERFWLVYKIVRFCNLWHFKPCALVALIFRNMVGRAKRFCCQQWWNKMFQLCVGKTLAVVNIISLFLFIGPLGCKNCLFINLSIMIKLNIAFLFRILSPMSGKAQVSCYKPYLCLLA